MNILIVYAHPAATSFNQSLCQEAVRTFTQAQHGVQLSDLYAMHFNPVANWDDYRQQPHSESFSSAQLIAYQQNKLSNDLKQEQEKILWSDVVIFQFPLWWFGMPAMLKGWFDRILTAGFAFENGEWFDTGLLKPRKAMLSLTTQSSIVDYSKRGMHEDIHQYLKPINHSLRFVGFTILDPFIIYGVGNLNEPERKQQIKKLQEHLLNIIR